MQVILLEKVVNLGGLGDVVKVKDGYARNYLLPQGKATRATPESLAEFEKKRTALEQTQSQALAAAQEKGTKLEGLMVQVTQKAGVDGRLFGSVTNVDIVDALEGPGLRGRARNDPTSAGTAENGRRSRGYGRAARGRSGSHQGLGAGRDCVAVAHASSR